VTCLLASNRSCYLQKIFLKFNELNGETLAKADKLSGAYGTVLQCPDVYLLYPKTEIDSERDIAVLNSPIVVKTRRVDISSSQAIENAESVAEAIATEKQLVAPNLKMA
jgi:hypothetical protein